MINKVKVVINKPKLPRLMLVKTLILNATNMIGYTINQLVYGTVRLTDSAITMFNNQLHTSKHNLTGWLCQSLLTKLNVACQSIKPCDQLFQGCLELFRDQHWFRLALIFERS